MDNDNIEHIDDVNTSPEGLSPAEQKKQEETVAGEKAAHILGKGLSTYFGGSAGSKAYDAASQTPIGKQAERRVGKQLNRNPLLRRNLRRMNNDGRLDALNDATNLITPGSNGNPSAGATGNLPSNNAPNNLSDNKPSNGLGDNSNNNDVPNKNNSLPEKEKLNKPGLNEGNEKKEDVKKHQNSKSTLNPLNKKSNNKNSGGIQNFLATVNRLKMFFTNPIFLMLGGGSLVVIFLIVIIAAIAGSAGAESSDGSGSYIGGGLLTYANCDYVTVVDPSTGSSEQVEFETYIAGVVQAENGNTDFPEAMKAQAIAARNFVLKQTANCTKSIENSSNTQNYKNPTEAAKESANATEGLVMYDNEGELVPGYYSNYPDGGAHNWSYGACDVPVCNDTTCTVSLYKVPSGSKISFVMDRYNNGNTWNRADLTNQGGHCYGMSQLGARYLDKLGHNYESILKTFYDYSTIAKMGTGGGSVGGTLANYTIRSEAPTSTNIEWTSENALYKARESLIGQCTWYANGRATEILKNSGLSAEGYNKAKNILDKMVGNAGTWYDTNKNLGGNGFAYGDEPRKGSIVVWGLGSEADAAGLCTSENAECGHVGIVEDILYNEDGTVKSLMISDGWKSGEGTSWDTVNFRYTEWSMEKVKSYNSGCRELIGFVYLLG